MNNDLKVLRYYSDYEKNSKTLTFRYSKPFDENLKAVREYVGLNLDKNSDLEKAHILLNYTNNSLISGNDDYIMLKKVCNSLVILEMSKTKKIKSNCFMYSTVLTELLLSYGIKARLIICRPFDFYKNFNCHCMVHAYIKELGRWIALDPSNCASFRDNSGNFISISELREKIIKNEKYSVFCFSTFHSRIIKSYLPYYLVSFFSFTYNGFNLYSSTESNPVNILLPILLKAQDCTHNNPAITYCDKAFWKE